MRKALIKVNNIPAAFFIENSYGTDYQLKYLSDYQGQPVSLTMPLQQKIYRFDNFPAFFDGLLPEGPQLENLLKLKKINRYDYFSQLMCVGQDMVGAVTAEEMIE